MIKAPCALSDGGLYKTDLSEADLIRKRVLIPASGIRNGIIQVKALGIRKNLPLAKPADLPRISAHIAEQTNKFLKENQVSGFEKESSFTNKAETFADGGQMAVGGKFLKIVSEEIGITTTLLKTGEVEETVYKTSTKKHDCRSRVDTGKESSVSP